MVQVKAKLSNFRMSPRKVRKAADLIRGKKVPQALAILSFTINKSAKAILKLLKSAVDSAKKNFNIDKENLFVSKITVDEGPKLKRWFPMSRGRAYPIMKRTSHIKIILSSIEKANGRELKNKKSIKNK